MDTGTANIGGPILKNKLFFYTGWEQTAPRPVVQLAHHGARRRRWRILGLKPQPAAAPNVQTAKFLIAKGDYQVNSSNRATVRWVQFHNDAPYNSGGGINTLERATDFLDAMDSIAGQLVTTFSANKLNELRVQYAHRHQSSVANSDSGTGPAILISGVAGFGGPVSATGQGNAGFDFQQNMTQVIDNFTYIRGNHSYKVGFDFQHVYDQRVGRAAVDLHVPDDGRVSRREGGPQPVRLLER